MTTAAMVTEAKSMPAFCDRLVVKPLTRLSNKTSEYLLYARHEIQPTTMMITALRALSTCVAARVKATITTATINFRTLIPTPDRRMVHLTPPTGLQYRTLKTIIDNLICRV